MTNLKGYQWLDKNGEVIMTYSLKFNKIYVWKDITTKDELEFYNFLKEKGFNCSQTDYQGHSNLDINKSVEDKIQKYLNGEL